MVQNIIITGASSGLGASLAYAYAAPGRTLGLLGRKAESLEYIAAQCRDKGAQIQIGILDVTDTKGMSEWLLSFDHMHPVDLVIANAGISAGTGDAGVELLEQAKRIFAVNVEGVMNTVTPLIESMKARAKGQIALVSSIAGFRGSPTAPAYSTSKAAVRIYGQALQGLLAQHGIHVSVICPGFIRTPMTAVNPFPMPFIMDADKAARIIHNRLAKRQKLIVFPWIMGVLGRLQNLLPDAWINRLYLKVPSKPSA